jgi:hypothetical protein
MATMPTLADPMTTAPAPAKLPPFSFAAESAAFQGRWIEEIPRLVHALHTQFIPERNILKYQHGTKWTFSNTQGEEVPGEFKAHDELLQVEAEPRVNGELEKLTVLADCLARKMAGATIQNLQETVEEVTEQTGNVVTWKKKEKNAPAAFLEMLRKLQFGVTEDGMPSLPSFFNTDPAFIAELQAHLDVNPAFKDEVERIKAQKIAEALGREAERKAKFKHCP